MNGRTTATLPVSCFRRSTALNLPSPPALTTCAAVCAARKSWSLASDVPPGLNARNTISSSFSVVGLSTTLTPFESCHSVMPYGASVFSRVIVPGVGGVDTSGAVVTEST